MKEIALCKGASLNLADNSEGPCRSVSRAKDHGRYTLVKGVMFEKTAPTSTARNNKLFFDSSSTHNRLIL